MKIDSFSFEDGQLHWLRLFEAVKRFVRVGKMTQVFKIQVLVAGDKFITLNMEGVYQKVQKVMRHTTVVDETADVTDLTFLHFLLELSDKVGTAGGVVNQYVSVTGDFDAVAGINIVAGENKVEVCP